jgi:hypothetical protein
MMVWAPKDGVALRCVLRKVLSDERGAGAERVETAAESATTNRRGKRPMPAAALMRYTKVPGSASRHGQPGAMLNISARDSSPARSGLATVPRTLLARAHRRRALVAGALLVQAYAVARA